MIALATKTMTAERTIGSHRSGMETPGNLLRERPDSEWTLHYLRIA